MAIVQPNTPLAEIFRLTPPQRAGLTKLRIATASDLLRHFPAHYGEKAELKKIQDLKAGDYASITAQIISSKTLKGYRSKIPMAELHVADNTGKIKAIWFHQAYMAKKVPEGAYARLTGTVQDRNGELYLANPELESISGIDLGSEGSLFEKGEITATPVYPETSGVTSLWLQHSVQKLLRAKVHELLQDPIPKEILARYNLPSYKTALVWIHTPKRDEDAIAARKRFAFEEIFFIQLSRQMMRQAYEANPTFQISPRTEVVKEFMSRFPFKPTVAQISAIETILSDFKSGKPMLRLLEGDVGSGKTAVAATTAYAAMNTKPGKQDFGTLQTAYMAPTEILAKQHFESFISYFKHLPVNIALITGSGCKKFPSKINPDGWTDISRTQLLKWVANGEIAILVGTHALIQKSVKFKHLAFVVIDEQHRFGVMQRRALANKRAEVRSLELGVRESTPSPNSHLLSPVPHLLSMTATPIPRTLALTIYGDLDLTLLDELPAGRKQIVTDIVLPAQRDEVYEKIKKEMKTGRQLYIICPRINEPDPTKEMAILAKSVTAEAERLQKTIFQEYAVGVMHGKLNPKEKEKIMHDFSEHKLDILVATSVVEVGVNVPNATIIIIEGAERFGLAQLHQLRGRVQRSSYQPYCYVFTDSKSEKSLLRLLALKDAKNGFELAEQDLMLRGGGELSGSKQWGISDLGMEAIKNIKMVEAARAEAKALIFKDPELRKYPALATHIQNSKLTHLE
ncbi:MAG: ATP-dependent DNA helicase RecG [Candidatus Paceibacterota bacterium]|jgi:ATP-dependent DNA helicase RecG